MIGVGGLQQHSQEQARNKRHRRLNTGGSTQDAQEQAHDEHSAESCRSTTYTSQARTVLEGKGPSIGQAGATSTVSCKPHFQFALQKDPGEESKMGLT